MPGFLAVREVANTAGEGRVIDIDPAVDDADGHSRTVEPVRSQPFEIGAARYAFPVILARKDEAGHLVLKDRRLPALDRQHVRHGEDSPLRLLRQACRHTLEVQRPGGRLQRPERPQTLLLRSLEKPTRGFIAEVTGTT